MLEVPKGFYLDANGNLQTDRRKTPDRRASHRGMRQHDLRKFFRRKADLELYTKDHKTMIDEALEEFAEEHGGHV
jgi:hypothetical protein